MRISAKKLSKVEEFVSSFLNTEAPPSLVFGVVSEGKVQWSAIDGKIDLEKDIPATADSIYPIASMTKSFVAAAILKLRDENKLSLTTVAKELVPQLSHDKRWNYLTVYDLLSHQTGLPYDDAWADRHAGISNEELTKIFAQPFTYACEPREQYLYSNLGYMILGRIVSEASGRQLQNYVVEEILKPLQMKSTVWAVGAGLNPPLEKFARGYVKREDEFVEEIFTDSIGDAGGFVGLCCSLNDLGIWVEFLCSSYHSHGAKYDSILSARSRREMQRATILIPDRGPLGGHATYAMGLRRHSCKIGWSVGHSGGLPGSGSHMRWHPELDLGVVALSNRTYCPVWNLCEQALDLLAEDATPKFPPNELTAKRGQELIKMILNGVDPSATDIFASNYFKDCPVPFATKLFQDVRRKIDAAKESAPHIEYRRGLAAEVYIGERSLFKFSLAPHEEGRIQSFDPS